MQALQTLNPADAAKVPDRHDEHTVADAAEYFPTAQLPVNADNPAIAQYDPAEQDMQLVDPVFSA